ncbi:hypothetical protein GCM10022221_69560 [Actinocorallia aurea]
MILGREDPPWVWVIFDEVALRNPIGGPDVMREQLEHLLKITELRRVSVRVLPERCGAHPGLAGAFRVLTLKTRDVAYAGAQRGGRLIEEPSEVEEFSVDFDRVSAKSLSEDLSRELIERSLRSYDRDSMA